MLAPNKPIKHGFTSDTMEYPWSSYLTILSTQNTKLKREEVLRYFDNRDNFSHMHRSIGTDDGGLDGLVVE
ncbi:MAG: hypothetical protein EA361_14630 [Bacteroidetes bacterium]|nr:MAG: hypothetical protein EA361_14630 [Bacteroidota bacterium]